MTTRSEALARGDRKYQGAPCGYGHCGVRYTNSGSCIDCAAARRNAVRAHLKKRRNKRLILYVHPADVATVLAVADALAQKRRAL
jgi:hypothetical protein